MPQESQLAHRVLTNLALPYITNVSPASTEPEYISGSQNILTSISGYAERRPGFSSFVEPGTPTVFNNLQRLFTWDRFDGTFIVMACDINASGFAAVYEMILGSQVNFNLIFTEPNPTGVPFDFVVSNNTVYFSNGSNAKKYDPVNGISNWGIGQYLAAASTAGYAGTGTDIAGGHAAWATPGNITGAPDGVFTTATLVIPASHPSAYPSDTCAATNYAAFAAIPAGNVLNGIQLDLTGFIDAGGPTWHLICLAVLFVNGAPTGSSKLVPLTNSNSTVTVGGPNDLWGTTALNCGVISTNTTFGVGILVEGFNGSGFARTLVGHLDAAHLTIFDSGGPVVTLAPGAVTATIGFQYVVCYGNSNTGHVSSPSPPSNLVKPTAQEMQIPVVASTDPQVNQIRVFRTTDSASGLGGQSYFEIPGSPFANTTTTVIDNNVDAALSVTAIAPTPTFNDPPFSVPPNGGMRGMVYYSGRIWGFANGSLGNKVWFTGLEEITIGVPEECIPSGIAGNFWSFDEPVQGLAAVGIGANQALCVFCGGRLYVIQGSTLDTFVRYKISDRRGTRNLTCISTLGGMEAWLDSASQVWGFDGTNMNEISPMIRPDLIGINPATSSLTFHTAGRFHWLVLSTGTKLYVFDVDQDQWMPPWTFAATYIYSGEISPGNYVLMASNGTTALQLNPSGTAGSYNDNGSFYQPVMKFGLLSVIPDYGSRFSYIGVGSYNEPTRTGYPSGFQVTNNGQTITDFLICSDDNPNTATYNSIAGNLVDTSTAYNRINGVSMTQKVYPVTAPASRWIGMEVKLANADQVDQVYEIFMAYKGLGGR